MDERFDRSTEMQMSGSTRVGVGAILVGIGAALAYLLRLARGGGDPGDKPGEALQCLVTPAAIRLDHNGDVISINSDRPGQYRPIPVHLPRDPNDLRRFGIRWVVNNTQSRYGRWVHIRNVESIFEEGQPSGAYIRGGRTEWFVSCLRIDVPEGRYKYDVWVDNQEKLDPEIVIIRASH